jgi:hypothetical protein
VLKRYAVLYRHYFYRLIPYEFDRGVYTAYFDALSKKQALASEDKGVDVEAQLSAIKVPVLLFAGRHDVVTPLGQTAELAKGLPHSKLVVMERSAHFAFSPSRELVADYAWLLDDEQPRGACTSDLFWAEIVSCEEAGEEEVCDITVTGQASWLADGDRSKGKPVPVVRLLAVKYTGVPAFAGTTTLGASARRP